MVHPIHPIPGRDCSGQVRHLVSEDAALHFPEAMYSRCILLLNAFLTFGKASLGSHSVSINLQVGVIVELSDHGV